MGDGALPAQVCMSQVWGMAVCEPCRSRPWARLSRQPPLAGPRQPSPATELDGLLEPLLVHGLLYLFCLKEKKQHRLEAWLTAAT